MNVVRVLLSFVMIGLAAATVASLVIRYRRSKGDEREQIRWLMLAGGVTVFWFVLPLNHGVGGWADFVQGFVLTLIPIAIGVAILKYHLYDIDLVLRKTLVFGVLAVFITLVYVAIVVGVGTAVGSSGNPVLSGIAAAIVALAFQPVRRWGQRLANRLVYGQRATPYEVLSEFSSRLGEAYDPEDVLPRMARILADGTGSKRADVWLHVGGQLRRARQVPVPRRTHATRSPGARCLPGSFPYGITMSSSVRSRPEAPWRGAHAERVEARRRPRGASGTRASQRRID